MINIFEVKELSAHGNRAKPVIAEITDNGCHKIISHKPNTGGYICLMRKRRLIQAHRLAYEIFISPIPEGLFVLHRCDNRPCCNPEHLFLGTKQDNNADMVKKGRQVAPRGVENGNAKLDDDKVREIRALAKEFTQKQTARMLGVSRSNVCYIVNGKRWGHVE